ncbi:MAG: tetratricopeptide repeat protein [Phycisphaerales bacterium]|nr:MAG: tetratricopeptide repeat protein [Phycisphaerales bacterium]
MRHKDAMGQRKSMVKKRKPMSPRGAQRTMARNTNRAPGRWRQWIGVAIVLLAMALLYLPALGHGFTNWDDDRQVTANPVIRDLSPEGLKQIASSFTVSLYQPLTSLVFALQYHFFELAPRAYHTVNVLLHLANTLLVYFLVRSLSQRIGIALIVCALFAIHPLQVEAVAWVSSLGILLSSTFYLGALIVYLAYTRSGKVYHLVLVGGLFLLALLAKSSAATLPLMLVVIDLYLARRPVRRAVLEKVPFLLLSIAFGVIAVLARGGAGHLQDFAQRYSLLQRACIICYSGLWYVGKLFYPANLSVFYPFPTKTNGWLPVSFYLAPLILVGVAVGIWYSGRYRRPLACAALFMVASLALVIQVVPISELMVCDRYAYIPCIGLFSLVAALVLRMRPRRLAWRGASLVCLAVVLVLLGHATFQRIAVWKDSLTLWNDVISKRTDLWVAYLNRGLAQFRAGRHEASIADFDAALRLNPQSDVALNNRGGCYTYLGQWQAALRDFDAAIQVNPQPDHFINRGVAKRKMGDATGALDDFNTIIAGDSRNVRALTERADTYRTVRDWNRAIADYEAVLRWYPGHARSAFWLGVLLTETGASERAVTLLQRAIDLGYRDLGSAYLFLGLAHQRLGQREPAIMALRKSQQQGDSRATAELRKLQ